MQIDVSIKIQYDNILDTTKSEIASGWVEIESFFKFPIKLRKYRDAETGNQKTFIAYPQRKNGEKYENVLFIHDKEVKEEVEAAIWRAFNKKIHRGMHTPDFEAVRVTLTDIPSGSVHIKGIASVKIAGFTINGFMIKEGKQGLFVNCPQYFDGKAFKDMVYGTSSMSQHSIENEILAEYNKQIELQNKNELSKDETQIEPKRQVVNEKPVLCPSI